MNEPGAPRVGVVLIGHGETASRLLDAAEAILGRRLEAVTAVDAGVGRDAGLDRRVNEAVESVDDGGGVVVLVDLLGSSPCACGQAEVRTHRGTVVSGLNLAMLCKVASMNRTETTAGELARVLAEAGRRAITTDAEVDA